MFNRVKTAMFSLLIAAAVPAFAEPSIEAIADELAAKPAAPTCRTKLTATPVTRACTDRLPDGSCGDRACGRQMVVPGAMALHAVRHDISMTFLNGSAELTNGAKTILDRFASRLTKVASYRPFTIEGHTDVSGTVGGNMTLSKARADSVVAYLSAKGVDANKMTAKGYGSGRPLKGVPSASPRNRRVELVAG